MSGARPKGQFRIATPPAGPAAEVAGPGPLFRLLADWATAASDRAALTDGTREWTYGQALGEVERLAARFAALGLPVGAPVGLCLSGGPEATLALLALDAAGLTPCCIPAHLDEAGLERVLALVDPVAIVTRTTLDELPLAAIFCGLAGRRFGLRFLLAFGPDAPDGVIALDAPEAARTGHETRPRPPVAGTVMVGESGAVFRSHRGLLAAAAGVVEAAGLRPGDVLQSALAPDDLAGLCAGPIAALLSGACLESEPIVDPRRLARPAGGRRHLALPGWAEETATALPGLDGLASLLLAGPAGPSAPPHRRFGQLVDLHRVGDAALVALRRPRCGEAATPPLRPRFLELRVGPDLGLVEVRGLAAAHAPYEGRLPGEEPDPESWHRVCNPESTADTTAVERVALSLTGMKPSS